MWCDDMGKKLLSTKEIEWAYEKWCAGYTCKEIAGALYCSKKTIERVVHGRPKIKPPLVYNGNFGENEEETKELD